jgi:predicted nucleotidyltransferase component of viral defense system
MLQLKTVEPRTFAILNRLMLMPEMQDFYLVGGTALSLMYGHRMSIDLDLFSTTKFENQPIVTALIQEFGDSFVTDESHSSFGIFGFIDDVKIDIIRYPHPLVRPTLNIESIRFFSTEDIIAMKVQAVLGRGKKKDFWDIAELLKHFTIEDFILFHKEKFSTQNLLITVPQALTYFNDAEDSEPPVSLKGQNWSSVKSFIQKKVSDYLR